MKYIDIVCSGELPDARLIEVEDDRGHSIDAGDWLKVNNHNVLRIDLERLQLLNRTEEIQPSYELMMRGSSAELEDVRQFQLKFGIPMPDAPSFLHQDNEDFRVKFMQEELDEFSEACYMNDMHGAADALVDLAYVLYGTVLMMGLGKHWDQLWLEVQRANMTKVRVKDDSSSKRKNSLDIVKPEGWVPPDHSKILGEPDTWPMLEK